MRMTKGQPGLARWDTDNWETQIIPSKTTGHIQLFLSWVRALCMTKKNAFSL